MNKTWFIDIDGTLVRHLEDDDIDRGVEEELLPFTLEFLREIRDQGDYIVITTARLERHRKVTEQMLSEFGIIYDHIIFGLGSQERVLINDIKPTGSYDGGAEEHPLPTAYAINMDRNEGFGNLLSKELWQTPSNAKNKVRDLMPNATHETTKN